MMCMFLQYILVVFCILCLVPVPSLTMEEASHPSQSDADQLHPQVNHNRPFFYVQPPSQPYFMCQWPMDPFGQYGFPGLTFPFVRPYMPPYQFMQFPGYVVPHAPMQPTDYRRIAPLFPSAGSYDLRFRQHFQQMSMHRETMSSEAQTEPGNPVSKPVDCQDGLQKCGKSGMVKEPSATFSSSPAVTSFPHEVAKVTYGDELTKAPASQVEVEQAVLAKPGMLGYSSGYDAESVQERLECGLFDVLPMVSSSICNEGQSQEQNFKQGDPEVPFFQNEKSGDSHITSGSHSTEVQDSGAHLSDSIGTSDLCGGNTSSLQSENVESLHVDCVEITKPLLQMSADCDLPYQILHLPCNKTTTGLLLQKDIDPLLYMDTDALLPSKRYAFDSPYANYYPQVVPERQSVLSPSLDELSSRDEMFSTDVEDDLSVPACVNGSKRVETSAVHSCSDMDPADKECSGWAKTCACCGASLPDEDLSPAELLDQDCDCELEEDAEEPCTSEAPKVMLRQHLSNLELSPCAQVSKHKLGQVQEVTEPSGQGHGRRERGDTASKGDKGRSRVQKGTQGRSYTESHEGEGPREMMDQENWAGCSGKQRSRSCRPANGLPEKGHEGRHARRRTPCKTFAPQRPKRSDCDHSEVAMSHCQRGRGSTKRRGTRY